MNTIAKTLLFIFCAGVTLVNFAQASYKDEIERARREAQAASNLLSEIEETHGAFSTLQAERLQHQKDVDELNSRLSTCSVELNTLKTSRNRVINVYQQELESNGDTEAAANYQAVVEQYNQTISELTEEIEKLKLQVKNKDRTIIHYWNQIQKPSNVEEETSTFYDYATWWPVTTSVSALTAIVVYVVCKYALARNLQLPEDNAARLAILTAGVQGLAGSLREIGEEVTPESINFLMSNFVGEEF